MLKIHLAAHVLLYRTIVDESGSGHIFQGYALASEQGYVFEAPSSEQLSCDYLSELADGFGEDDAGLQCLEEVAGLKTEFFAGVYGDEARALYDVSVDLGLEQEVRSSGVDVGTRPEPLTVQNWLSS